MKMRKRHRRVCTVLRLFLAGAVSLPLVSTYGQDPVSYAPGPLISLWYGQVATFGGQGIPQPVFNILGNVSSSSGVASLRYTLNGGPAHPLSIGPDTRRLALPGDFNLDIRSDSLIKWPQLNTVTITATDSQGRTSSATVQVANRTPSRWRLPYEVSWSSVSSLADSAQVVDGKWSWVSGQIMAAEPSYDRLVAIGDTGWTNYEVKAELTALEIDTSKSAYDAINGGPALGLIFRWNGHTNTPVFNPPITQPLSGYLPYGAIGCFHWTRGTRNRWEIVGNNLHPLAQDSSQGMEIGTTYIYRMRVVTLPGTGQTYSLKYWKASSQEPAGWQLSGVQDSTNPGHGSFLLYAHHVKGVFGKVSIEPLSSEVLVTAIDSLPGANSAYITWKTNAKSSGKVLFGKTLALPDTAKGDTLLSTVHPVLLPDLLPSTRYQIKIVATTAQGSAITPALGTFTTAANQPPLAFRSDRFDSTSINTSRWVFINPDPPSTFSLVRDKNNGALSIAVPHGPGHDIWAGNNAPRIMQPAMNMDFQAEAKFLSLPSAQYQLEGILAEQDFSNFIRFDFYSDAFSVNAFTASFEGGVPTVRGKVQTLWQSPLFLRVTRTGNLWRSFFSHDSVNWTVASTFTSAMRMNSIGLYSGNAPGPDSTAPAFTGIMDYLVNQVLQANDVPFGPSQAPLSFGLEQNYPNPFNPLTIIKYTIGGAGGWGLGASEVQLVMYDLLGREVATLVNERKQPGTYEVTFDGRSLASGVYFYRLRAGSFVASRKMLLVR
jgi:hypothetical protein